MPSGPRIRANNVYGTISDNPLLIGATSFTSLGLSLLPAVSAQHAVLVFDPKRVFGEPEIVVVTSHLALGTTATITRGAYGTAARQHPQDTAWAHVPVGPDDYTAIVTSGTRPSDPYEGQFIFESDTNKLMGFGGVDWAPRDAGGQIAYVSNVAGQVVGAGPTDLTGLTSTLTYPTGRRIKITVHITQYGESDATTGHSINIFKDGVDFQRVHIQGTLAAVSAGSMFGTAVDTPSAGSHTYKVVALRYTGAGNMTIPAGATLPMYMLIEDIGAA